MGDEPENTLIHRLRLPQAREPGRLEEQLASAARLGCGPDAISPLELLSAAHTDDDLVQEIDAVLVSGSDRSSGLDDEPERIEIGTCTIVPDGGQRSAATSAAIRPPYSTTNTTANNSISVLKISEIIPVICAVRA